MIISTIKAINLIVFCKLCTFGIEEVEWSNVLLQMLQSTIYLLHFLNDTSCDVWFFLNIIAHKEFVLNILTFSNLVKITWNKCDILSENVEILSLIEITSSKTWNHVTQNWNYLIKSEIILVNRNDITNFTRVFTFISGKFHESNRSEIRLKLSLNLKN